MGQDEPDFLMSLNDTLTCAFGASVLLFVVFVVVVSLQDLRGRGRDASSLSTPVRFAASLNDADSRSYEPLLIRVRADCEFVRSVRARDLAVRLLRDGRETETTCVAVFRVLFDPLRHASFDFTSEVPPIDAWHVTILLGGFVVTQSETGCKSQQPGRTTVFSIGLSDANRLFRSRCQ